MHIHGTGSTSATRLNSVPITATMYKIPREQWPFHERINETKCCPAITGVIAAYCLENHSAVAVATDLT